MEGIFALDQTAQEIKKLLLASNQQQGSALHFERAKVTVDDIKEIVLVCEDFALVKVRKEARASTKYQGNAHVAVPLQKVVA